MAEIIWDPPEVEYIDGHPCPKVSPKRVHGIVQLAIATIMQRCAQRRGDVVSEWRFKLTPGLELVPDVGYVSFDRLRPLTDEEAEEPPFAPDIAAEVRSPSHRHTFTAQKIQQYLTHGTLLVLDIDPYARKVYAHTSATAAPTIYGSGERFSCEVLPWLQFDVAELFAKIKIPR